MSMRARFAALLAAVLTCTLAAPAVASAATADVYLLRGEQFSSVEREVDNGASIIKDVVAALLAGPTAAEKRRDYSTAIPADAKLVSSKVDRERGLVSVVFDARFSAPPAGTTDPAEDEREYDARLGQVVHTITSLTSTTQVEIAAPGKKTVVLDRDDYDRPAYQAPETEAPKAPKPNDVKGVQTALARLSYLPASAADGKYGPRTEQAILAFQSWEGLTRDGRVGAATAKRLGTAKRPVARDRTGRGRKVEIHRGRSVVLLVEGGVVKRAIHTSTGRGGSSPDTGTPPGRFKVYRKEARSWSVPFRTWLPYATYWDRGWALHGYGDVPAFPASHGCARLPMSEAKGVFDFTKIGTPVLVV